jgi:hypothetical protein
MIYVGLTLDILHHPVLKVQKRTEAKIGSITQKETSSVTLHGLVLEDGSLEDLPQEPLSRVRLSRHVEYHETPWVPWPDMTW